MFLNGIQKVKAMVRLNMSVKHHRHDTRLGRCNLSTYSNSLGVRTFKIMTGLVVSTATLIAVVPQPANAAAYSCSTGFYTTGAWAICTRSERSSDTFRVAILCYNWLTRSSRTAYGPWMKVSQHTPSVVDCGGHPFEVFYGKPRATNGW